MAKSKQAPACARQAVAEGADLLFVWGGDGTVQRCVDAVAGSDVALAVIPAGTANLLAGNLGIPQDIAEAVRIGLHGDRRSLDTGTVNGEHFAVMAGAGLDALMITEADAGLKDRMGRAAYLWTGARNLDASPVKATVKVDGRRFHKGTITCVLAGNMGQVLGGVEVFDGSQPDDGLLEVGVVTARSRLRVDSDAGPCRRWDDREVPVRRHGAGHLDQGDVRHADRLRARRRVSARPSRR